MFFIQEIYKKEITINKSRFIGTLIPVDSVEEANKQLDLIRKKYYDATHNCYAYIIGLNQEIQKCSDDGEPQKTAGAPIIDVLKKKNLTNVLMVVTRYFGGILLGAGGLVRAYSETTSLTTNSAKLYVYQNLLETTIPLSYKDYNTFKKLPYVKILLEDYNLDVRVTFQIVKSDYNQLVKDLQSILKFPDLNLEFSETYALIENEVSN